MTVPSEKSAPELLAQSFMRAASVASPVFDSVVLDAQQRHIRRKLLTCQSGGQVLVDFTKPAMLHQGDCLVLEDGRLVEIVAAMEDLMELRGPHLAHLAWHIGNRHLEAQIEPDRILLRRDPVIAHMLEQQGATVRHVSEAFEPERGAYHTHDH
jgi:urease accessory protein